jgi:hypothetical protein
VRDTCGPRSIPMAARAADAFRASAWAAAATACFAAAAAAAARWAASCAAGDTGMSRDNNGEPKSGAGGAYGWGGPIPGSDTGPGLSGPDPKILCPKCPGSEFGWRWGGISQGYSSPEPAKEDGDWKEAAQHDDVEAELTEGEPHAPDSRQEGTSSEALER